MRFALAAVLLLAACPASDDTSSGSSAVDHDHDLCDQAQAAAADAGCDNEPSDYCDTHTALYDRAGCTDEDVAWWQCILAEDDDPTLVCDHQCDYNPSVDCLTAYCENHLDDPDCPRPPSP